MANTARNFVVCRCCVPASKPPRDAALHNTRAFSSSAKRCGNGSIPEFRPTQSQALSDLLESVRSKVFLPAYLSESQRKLVYQSRNHALLRNDPFYIEIGPADSAERFLLEPIDRMRDVPNSWRSVRAALLFMSGTELNVPAAGVSKSNQRTEVVDPGAERHGRGNAGDWANLVPLLVGMRAAGRRWKPWQWEYIIRMTGKSGASHALLDAARQMERTGLYLTHIRIAREVFWACRTKAMIGNWSLEATTKALSYALQFSKLLDHTRQRQEAQHAMNRGDLPDSAGPLVQPDVIGVVLELASTNAESLSSNAASEETILGCEAVVKAHASRLAPHLQNIEPELITNRSPPAAAAADYELLRWVPVLSGLRAAERVLGSDLPYRSTLTEAIPRLERLITEARKTIADKVGGNEGGKRLGLEWSQSLVAP